MFAPKCIIDEVNIQEYLQTSFRNAFAKLTKQVAAAGELLDEAVISWDRMKEPAEGLSLWGDLNAYRSRLPLSRTPFRPFHDLKRLLTSIDNAKFFRVWAPRGVMDRSFLVQGDTAVEVTCRTE
jgi:hypothetical protein